MSSSPTILIVPDLDAEGSKTVDPGTIEWLERAGAQVRVVEPRDSDPFEDSGGAGASAGGLLLAGGFFDLPPSWYGQRPRARIDSPRLRRSRMELLVLRTAWDCGRAVLGICGGAQLMAVERGGTLVQDIATELPDALDHEHGSRSGLAVHRVRIADEEPLEALFGARDIEVNSTHHQCIREPGRGLQVAARAPDGVIEAIWDPERAFWLGVQWHPERLASAGASGLAREFVRAASRASRLRSR